MNGDNDIVETALKKDFFFFFKNVAIHPTGAITIGIMPFGVKAISMTTLSITIICSTQRNET